MDQITFNWIIEALKQQNSPFYTNLKNPRSRDDPSISNREHYSGNTVGSVDSTNEQIGESNIKSYLKGTKI